MVQDFSKHYYFQQRSHKLTSLEKKYHAQYSFLFMKPSGDQLRIIANLIESGKIKPVIDRTFHLKMLKRRWNMRSQVEQKGRLS